MNLLKTPLHSHHIQLGAKMVPFAGYEMPVSYDSHSGGTMQEHLAVRNRWGIFDVSHMGEFWLTGPQATEFLNFACTRPFDKLADGRAQYCLLLNETGTIVDDIIVYRFNSQKYWIVVNAANIEKDWQHLCALKGRYDVDLKNVSDDTALLAIQGPEAIQKLATILPIPSDLKYYSFFSPQNGWIVARTGYTGEDGVEVFLPASDAQRLWSQALELGCTPIGLGARDTLRLEVGFPLYGHELSDDLYPLETFASFAIKGGREFWGSRQALSMRRYVPIAIETENPKPVRQGDKLFFEDREVGVVTSGSTSPVTRRGIGLALLRSEFAEQIPAVFMLESSGKRRQSFLRDLPFVQTARVKSHKVSDKARQIV